MASNVTADKNTYADACFAGRVGDVSSLAAALTRDRLAHPTRPCDVAPQVFFKHHPEVTPLGLQLLAGVSREDAVHVLAQLEIAPLCTGHTLCWEGGAADSIWLLQVGARFV